MPGAGLVQGDVPAAVPGGAGGNVDEVAAQRGGRRQVASASRSELEPPPPGISPSAIRWPSLGLAGTVIARGFWRMRPSPLDGYLIRHPGFKIGLSGKEGGTKAWILY